MDDREVIKFRIDYKGGVMKYFTDFIGGSVEIHSDGRIIAIFERSIEYSDEYDYGYGYNYDLPKKETYEYKINQWEIQRIFFNRYDLLALTPVEQDEIKENNLWEITIITETDSFSIKGTNYPNPYGEEFFDGLKRLIKYKVVPDLP